MAERKKKTRRSTKPAELGAVLAGANLVGAHTARDYWRELFVGLRFAAQTPAAGKLAILAHTHANTAAREIARRTNAREAEKAALIDTLQNWISAHFGLAAAAAKGCITQEAVRAFYREARLVADTLAFLGSWEGRPGFLQRFISAGDAFVELVAAGVAGNKEEKREAAAKAAQVWAVLAAYAVEWLV